MDQVNPAKRLRVEIIYIRNRVEQILRRCYLVFENQKKMDDIHGQQSMGVHGERKRTEEKTRMTEKMLTFGKSEKRQIMIF